MKQFSFKRCIYAFFLSLLAFTELNAQNTLDLVGLSSTAPTTTAYSLRKLSSSYAGKAIQVRRSSDNATQDIGFTAGGNLDTAALKTFVGTNDGLVSIWYDQSGNGSNATQANTSLQPYIVSAGVIFRTLAMPSIYFNGSNYMRAILGSLNPATNHTLNSVSGATTGNIVTLSSTSAGEQNSCLGAGFNGAGAWFGGYGEDVAYNAGTPVPNMCVRTKVYNAGTITGYINGTSVLTTNITYNLTTADVMVGIQNNGGNQNLLGSTSEVLVFTSALSNAEVQTVETNQNNYYGLYLTLSSLTVSSGSLTPTFTPKTTFYTTPNIGLSTNSVTVTPTTTNSGTLVSVSINKGNFTTTASGTTSGPLTTDFGPDTIDIKVSANNSILFNIYKVALFKSDILTWTGATSSNWNDAGNWDAGMVPTKDNRVIIPTGLTNYPVINAGTTALAKYISIESGSLTLNANSTLTVNGFNTENNNISINNAGILNNSGTIIIGGTTAHDYGIYNQPSAQFNNNSGAILTVDYTNNAAIFNDQSSISNSGTITIGANSSNYGIFNNTAYFSNGTGASITANLNGYPIYNDQQSTFTNDGQLSITGNSSISYGIYNGSSSSFSNSSTINITAPNVSTGITNGAVFSNTGNINITNTTSSGINNVLSFTNSGTINITGIGGTGIAIGGGATFSNNSVASNLNIKGNFTNALLVQKTFNNSGTITIGAQGTITNGVIVAGASAAYSNATTCASLYVLAGNFTLTRGTVTNKGYILIAKTLTKGANTFTNQGVLKYTTVSGSITNSGNAAVIVKDNPTPIFTYGGTYSGTVNGIYSDAAATVSAGSFSAPNTFTPGVLPAGLITLYAKITPTGGCAAFIVPFIYNNSIFASWTGTNSTNWNDVGNWDIGSVPTSSTAVVIPVVTNYPVLTAATNAGCIKIATGANINLNGQSLTTAGITGLGTLIGSATSSLTIHPINSYYDTLRFGTGATDSLLATLSHSSAGITTIASGVGITGLVSVTAGTLNTNGHLTLKSTSITNTASLDVVAGTITGIATVERYIPKGLRSFRDLSAGGVANAGSFYNNWQEGGATIAGKGIYITGKKGVASGVDATTGLDITSLGNSSLYAYGAGVWPAVTNTKSNSINPFQGYRVLVRGDRNYNNFGFVNDAAVMNNSTVLRTSGNLITGNVTYSTTGVTNNIYSSSAATLVAGTAAYSLIANPYACPIDWEAVYANTGTGNISSSYWYFDPTFMSGGYATYVTYNAVSHVNSNPISKVNRYIQPGAAFFVQNSGTTPTVAFTESNKVPNSTKTAVFRTEAPNYIHVSLWKNINEENTNIDGAVAVFNSNFTKVIGDKDSKKLTNGGENIFITQSNTDLSIAGLPVPTENEEIKLNLSQLVAGTIYQLQLDASQFTTTGIEAFIKDNMLNTIVPAIEGINFTPTNDAASYQGRFSVIFKAAKVNSVIVKGAVSIYPNPVANGKFNLQMSNLEKGTYTVRVINSLGQEVMSSAIYNEAGSVAKTIATKGLTAGVFTVQVVGKSGSYNTELIVK